MKKISMALVGLVVSMGSVVADVCSADEGKERRARQFLEDTSPRATNGHPKASDNIVDKVYSTGPSDKNEPVSDYINETEY